MRILHCWLNEDTHSPSSKGLLKGFYKARMEMHMEATLLVHLLAHSPLLNQGNDFYWNILQVKHPPYHSSYLMLQSTPGCTHSNWQEHITPNGSRGSCEVQPHQLRKRCNCFKLLPVSVLCMPRCLQVTFCFLTLEPHAALVYILYIYTWYICMKPQMGQCIT